ncbi:PilZ domain protein [bacterium BMS3Bbin08]|nr:PilZ domain protein [bacterium BMS3Bbin08]
MERRRSRRIIKRLEATFTSEGGVINRGITSNLSREGLFIRTLKGLLPNNRLELKLYLPSGEALNLHAIVRRTVKTQFQSIKNGMGIELITPPPQYTEFVQSIY